MSNIESPDKPVVLNLNDAVTKALRLNPERWEVTGAEVCLGDIGIFSDDDPDASVLETTSDDLRSFDTGSMCIHVSMRHGLRHECKDCGRPMKVNKWVSTSYKSSPVMNMRTTVRVSVPKMHCTHCMTFPKADCPLVVKNHTYTKLMKFDVLASLSQETAKATAEACRVGISIVSDVLSEAVEYGRSKQDMSGTTTLFVDEIQSTHGQNYITMVADQDHVALEGTPGHDIESMRRIRDYLVKKGGDPMNILYICADMHKAYKSGAKLYFPRAKLIIDHFHLAKLANVTVDEVRKRTNRELKKANEYYPTHVKYTVLYRSENHNAIHRARMEDIRLHNPVLATAFDLKEEYLEAFKAKDKHEARSLFMSWYNRARASKIPEMVDLAERVLVRLNDILRWFDHRISNAVSEGLNNTYKKIKSAAYGFRKEQNLIDMCLFRKGHLAVRI